jgi:hypothetical protein
VEDQPALWSAYVRVQAEEAKGKRGMTLGVCTPKHSYYRLPVYIVPFATSGISMNVRNDHEPRQAWDKQKTRVLSKKRVRVSFLRRDLRRFGAKNASF